MVLHKVLIRWDAFKYILVLIIYGVVLFPNVDEFMDMTIVTILLVDVYYYVHCRNQKKGGMLNFCTPLLYKWVLAHLPRKGPFVENKENVKWSQRISSLNANDIF